MVKKAPESLLFWMNQEWIHARVAATASASTIRLEGCSTEKVGDWVLLISIESDPIGVVPKAGLPGLLSHADDAEEFCLACIGTRRVPSRKCETDPSRVQRRHAPQFCLERA
jgi:hypothetical protein